MAMRWITDDDKAGLQLDDEFYSCKGIDVEGKIELTNRLNLQAATWSILYGARNAFALGTANYENATENLQQLLPELFKSLTQLERTFDDISKLFDPPLPIKNVKTEGRVEIARLCATNLPIAPKKVEAKIK